MIWRDVAGYEGMYQVSNCGDVRRLAGVVNRCDGTTQALSQRALKPRLKNSGYLFVSLNKDNKQTHFYVHQLVAMAFVGDCPAGYVVNHKDGVKTNNRVENLEYVTHLENMRHAIETGLFNNRGEKHYGSKLTADDVQWIRFAHGSCGIFEEIVDSYDVSEKTIRDVLNYRTWRHLA